MRVRQGNGADLHSTCAMSENQVLVTHGMSPKIFFILNSMTLLRNLSTCDVFGQWAFDTNMVEL